MREYVTVSGDTWDLIAFKTLGNDKLMHLVMEANKDFIPIVVFPPGISLTIPSVQNKMPEILPPWKRGAR